MRPRIYLPYPDEIAGEGEASVALAGSNGRLVPKPITTVPECLEAWLSVKRHSLNSISLDNAERYAASFSEHVGPIPISEAKQFQLTYWLLDHPEWESEHTRQNAQGCVVAAFRWAREQGLISTCPYFRVRTNPLLPRLAIRPDEFHALLSAARECSGRRSRRKRPSSGPFRKLIWFLWETGCRPCEAREARWADVDWSRGLIELTNHKTFRATGVSRIITLTRAARLMLWLDYRNRRPAPGDPIFVKSRGGSWNRDNLIKLFGKYARIAGIRKEISAYCLRHGFVVDALEAAELNERQVADLIGQKTTRYIEWYSRTLRNKTDYLKAINERVRRGRRER